MNSIKYSRSYIKWQTCRQLQNKRSTVHVYAKVLLVIGMVLLSSASEKSYKKNNLVSWEKPSNSRRVYHEVRSPDLWQHEIENALGFGSEETDVQKYIERNVLDEASSAAKSISDDANTIQKTIKDDFNWTKNNVNERIQDIEQIGSSAEQIVSSAVTKVTDKVVDAGNWMEEFWDKAALYWHRFLRTIEVIGLLVLLYFLFKVYGKASSITKVITGIFGHSGNSNESANHSTHARNETAVTTV